MSYSLQPVASCPSLSPGVCSNSCPLSQWWAWFNPQFHGHFQPRARTGKIRLHAAGSVCFFFSHHSISVSFYCVVNCPKLDGLNQQLFICLLFCFWQPGLPYTCVVSYQPYVGSLVWQSASLVAQKVKDLPAIQETWVWTLGWEDPLKKGMATHSSILTWRIHMYRGAWQATAHGSQSRYNWAKHSTQHKTRAMNVALRIHMVVAIGFLKTARDSKPPNPSTFQASSCTMLTKVPLSQGSHRTKTRFRGWRDTPPQWERLHSCFAKECG